MADIQIYRSQNFNGVKALWEECFPNDPPWNKAEVVIPAKIASQPDLFLVAADGDHVIGAALAGYDGHRGWLYSVAVTQDHQRLGIGSQLVKALEARLRALSCRKINLQIIAQDVALARFYHSLGFDAEDRISMGKLLNQSLR